MHGFPCRCLASPIRGCKMKNSPGKPRTGQTKKSYLTQPIVGYARRDKTRVQMLAKNVSSFEKYNVSCLWAPLLVLTRSKETVS